MKIKIYQANMERDENRVAFMAYESLAKFQDSPDVDSRIYDKVFEGEVNCFTLEKLYEIFNREHPAGYKGRSMSVSDVVEIVDGTTGKSYFNFSDSFGFQQVSFEPDKTQISERFCDGDKAETISVLLIQPGKYPKTVTIEDSLEAMQELVGGDIEEYMPFDDEAAIICNEEGKISGLPLNRAVYDFEHQMIEIMAGDFFICHAPISSEKFLSLPPDLEKKCSEKFRYPEKFVQTDKGIKAIPYKPAARDMER
ncbi:DUF3846 domain-containing protein [Acutalibacter sp. 1XD8-33]|uniref:DUF3846 domain-containing protein n=1 Tax=Acutalibacter sp. 1XD8-33 TaxID=2320081 RepID=UPI001FAA14E8|nr:DUF3846 domain-containing protein [Acutalibacter sp. 1XD8-33]